MDHIWKTLGFLGLEILEVCNSHPIAYSKDGLETEVAGAMVGMGLLLVSIVCLVACVCCRESQRKGFKEFRDSTHSLQHTGLSFTNPGLSPGSELAIFPPPGVTSTASVTFEPLPSSLSPSAAHCARKPSAHRNLAPNSLNDDDWFANGDLDFPRQQLQYLRECGRGWFGRVVEGEARGLGDNRYKVMVRILREDATPAEQKYFLNEAKPYRDLNHPHVLKMVGRCLETNPYLVLLEACSAGDLKSFLCGNLTSSSVLCQQGVCMRIMCQVATGLQHMISHGFVHTDLAARSCLVTSDLTVKVGDYGTSIETYKEDYYIAGDVAVPVRWCAPETLHCTDTTIETKQVTAESNVWSLGVLLWEVCQFGQMPYSELTDDQVIVRVLGAEGMRLPPPTLHPLHANALYTLMSLCWQPTGSRASLDHLLSMLNHLHSSHSEEDFQRRWDALRPNSTPEINLEALTVRSYFDSGVDLEIKSADREIIDLVKKSSSDVNMSPCTASPQLSVASSSGGEFFSQTSLPILKKQLSPSLTNLRGSVEDISKPMEETNTVNISNDTEEFDSWLKGVETTNEEDVKFVKKISEAIKDLDDALALEKTSSSSDDSSRHESPLKDCNSKEENPILDFRLGPSNKVRKQISVQPDSLQDDSLVRRDSSETDTEDETWRGRIERGEFSEKVKEKSKSVTDLMILTHIESEGSESDSLPSLTRQYSIDKTKRKLSATMMTTIGFGSEGNIRGAVLGDNFQDALKQLQAEWKFRDLDSRESSLQLIKNETHPTQTHDKLDFLANDASEKQQTPVTNLLLANEVSVSPSIHDSLITNSPSFQVESKISTTLIPYIQNNFENKSSEESSLEIREETLSTITSANALSNEQKECSKLPENSKLSPEGIEVSEVSQPTESSSEISTPTQYEVITTMDNIESFISAEKDHGSLLQNKVIGFVEIRSEFERPLKNVKAESELEDSFKTCTLGDTTEECSSKMLKTMSNPVKIVPNINVSDDLLYETASLKADCDIIHNPEGTFVNDEDNKYQPATNGKINDTLVHENNNLLSNSATTQETNEVRCNNIHANSCETIIHKQVNTDEKESTPLMDGVPPKSPNFVLSSNDQEMSTFVPEIVVTEASILDIDDDSEPEYIMPVGKRPRRSIKLIMSSSDDSEDDCDEKSFEKENISIDSNFKNETTIITSTPFIKSKKDTPSEDIYRVDTVHPFSPKSDVFVVPFMKDNQCSPNNQNNTSVILGSCEDYTLDYFKGLKTTLGKQVSDESIDEFSKSEEDEEEKKNTSINHWDTFLTTTLDQKYPENIMNSDVEFENSDNDLELNDKNKAGSMPKLNDYPDEKIIESKIKFSEHINDDVRKDVMICDRIFENINEKKNYDDHDQQMQEVKNRLEDVAMLSEGFCLKNQSISMDDDEDGKLLTPDDERSSDSGFRDKGSLSESVEDACDEKYNLEDIDAELEEQYGRNLDSKSGEELEMNKTYVKEVTNELKDDLCSNEHTFLINDSHRSPNQGDLPVTNVSEFDKPSEKTEQSKETVKVLSEPQEEEKQERLNKLDSALDSDIDHYFQSRPQEKSGWYLHPPPSTSSAELESVSSGWLPSAPEESKDTSYVSFEIDEEYVTAIRNELREKLPCAQNPDRTDNEEDVSPEEERTDMVIQYNTYPASLSPIFEERESISSNQSSLLLDETGKSIESSGKSSPVLYLEAKKEDEVLSKFEDDIINALDLCNSESTDSENILVTVEDLENSKDGKAQKVVENPKDDMDDLLIVDTETNKVTLYESPRPRSHLAFIKQMVEPCDDSSSGNSETFTFYHSADDDNLLSVERNNLTYTPDSVSPLSSGSSRTGAAVSFSSSETCGNLSGFYLSPSSVRSDMFDNGPPSLPFDLGQIYDLVEEIKPNNEAEEIVQKLVEAGILNTKSNNETNSDIISCGLISSKESSDGNSEIHESGTSDGKQENSFDSSVEKSEASEISTSKDTTNSSKSNSNSSSSQICSTTPKNNSITSCDKIDEMLENKNQLKSVERSKIESTIDDSKDWLKSVLLPSSTSLSEQEDTAENKSVLVCLNEDGWPKSEELVIQPIVTVNSEPQIAVTTPESPSMDLLEVAAKFYDVNSTLAISTPNNVSFDESKDNSQLSSFTSTPTLETAKCISGAPKIKERPVILEHVNHQTESTKSETFPTLKDLANGIVLKFTEVKDNNRDSEDSSPDDSERSRKLQGMTLALESSVVSKAPMPSPEDAEKGIWRPTMGQLIELTNQPEQDDMMTTSFIDTDNNEYAPDWESDTSDDSEDHSSSSGEFIWREGDKEEAVRVVIACHDLEPQEGVSEMSMARISEEEGEDEEGEDNSSCASTTEFIPSVWDSHATPTKSALRSAEKPKSEKRNVIFKRQKYHCVYEYPREPSDSEDEEEQNILQRRTWQSPSTFDYSTYADWEYGEGDVDDAESDSDDNNGPRQLPESEYDFYRLSNLDFETMTQMNLDDGEFFISSSARPFQMGESSQFFPGSISDDDFLVEFQPCAADTEAVTIPSTDQYRLDETITGKLKEVTKREDNKEDKEKQKPTDLFIVAEPLSEDTSSAEVSPTLGELRHTRQRLKLDLGRGGVRGEASLLDSGGEDSGVESTATGSSDRLDQVQSSEV